MSNSSLQAEDISRFARLFMGNDRSVGRYHPRTRRMETKHRGPALEDYEEHLIGKTGVGVVPIMDDSNCWFGAIDIDAHGADESIDLIKLEEEVRERELPLIVCRSKSGGAHLYVFGKEPLPAEYVRVVLAQWASDLGFPGVEVFPKQSVLPKDPDTGNRQFGNWINLPYFCQHDTERYQVHRGKEVSFDFFLTAAETSQITASRLDELRSDGHAGAPPCLQRLINEGCSSGARNEAMYNLTVYMRKAFPEEYRDKLFDLNNRIFDVPLPHSEARRTITSASKRDYRYKCREAPIKDLCDRQTCLKRRFGISPAEAEDLKLVAEMPEIGPLYKYMTEPARWELMIGDKPVILTTTVLYDWKRIRVAYTDTHTSVLPMIPAKEWERQLRELTENAILREAPEEASTTGQMRWHLREFLRKADLTSDGEDLDERKALLRGVPVVQKKDDGRVVYFRGPDFVAYLKRNRSEELKDVNLFFALRGMGGREINHCKLRVGSQAINVWYVPLDEDGEPTIDVPDFNPGF